MSTIESPRQNPLGDALRNLTLRYERLMKALSILRDMDDLNAPQYSFTDVAQRILEKIAAGLAAENASLMMLDESRRHLDLRAASSPLDAASRVFSAGQWHGHRFRVGEGAVGCAVATGAVVRVDDTQADRRFAHISNAGVEVRSLLCFPLKVQGEVIGVLNLSHSHPGFFNAESEYILSFIAERAANIFNIRALYARLEASETHYRLVTENADDAILVFDRAGKVLSANPAVGMVTGRNPARFVAGTISWRDVVHPDDQKRYQAHHAALLRKPKPSKIVYSCVDVNGVRHDLEQHTSPLMGSAGEVTGIVAVARDVTARKRAEHELEMHREHLEEMVQARSAELLTTNRDLAREVAERREAETAMRRLAGIIEQSTESVTLLDAKGLIEYVNPAFEQNTGYSRAEVIGKDIRILGRREDRERHEEITITLLDGKVWRGSLQIRRKDASVYEEYGVLFPLRNEAGAMAGFAKLARDITHERLLEAQLRQAQKMEAIGSLAGGIAHDFNNILYAILGYTELAILNLPSKDSALYEDLDEVRKAGKRATDLVRQILTFSRRSEVSPQPLRLQSLIKEATRLLRATIPSTIQIQSRVAEDCGPVMADPTQIHQVLMNLCTNACHSMRHHGGRLEVRLDQMTLGTADVKSIPDLTPGTYACLVVRDTGCGMSPDTMDRVFEPYFTTKHQGEGTGLGLATVHGIVKSHSGAITVESTLKKGSIFRTYLPICSGKGMVVEDSRVKLEFARRKAGILVVDDELPITNLLKRSLSQAGYKVSIRSSSTRALQLFRTDPEAFDLVITDQTMPEMTGIEMARHMLKIRPDIPIILCSGYSEVVDEKTARNAGLSKFLLKPIIPNELSALIARLLEKKNETQARRE